MTHVELLWLNGLEPLSPPSLSHPYLLHPAYSTVSAFSMEIDPALLLLIPASPQQPQTHPIDRHYFPEISLGPDLLKEDFPALSDSWTRKAYESFKSRTTMGGVHGRPRRGSKAIKEDNENVMMTFVQDKNGVPVDGETAKAIRARAADLFSAIATLREDCVAATWGQVDSNGKDFFYTKICQFWLDLRMCAFNWKANAVGAIVYPRWYKHFKLEKQRKRQLENNEEDGQNKRQRKLGPSPPSSFPQLRSLSQSPPPPSLPPSPVVSSSEATATDSPSDTPTSSQQIIPVSLQSLERVAQLTALSVVH